MKTPDTETSSERELRDSNWVEGSVLSMTRSSGYLDASTAAGGDERGAKDLEQQVDLRFRGGG